METERDTHRERKRERADRDRRKTIRKNVQKKNQQKEERRRKAIQLAGLNGWNTGHPCPTKQDCKENMQILAPQRNY